MSKRTTPLRAAAALLLALTLLLTGSSFVALADGGSYTVGANATARSANVTDELNRAIKAGYSTINLPQGEYEVSDTINIVGVNNLTINGNGSVLRTVDHNASVALQGIRVRNSSNVTLNDFSLLEADAHGIYVDNSTATFNGLTVTDSQYCGVDATGTGTNLTMNNCKLNHNGLRPRSTVATDDAVASGLGIYKGASVTATDCDFNNNIACGVCVTDNEGSHATLYGAVMDNNGDHGVGSNPKGHVDMAASAARRCSARGNKNHGVMLHNSSSSNFIKDTDMEGNGLTGLDLNNKSTAALVENCNIVNNGDHGILVSGGAKLNNLKNCTVKGSKHHGIYISSSTLTMNGSRVENGANDGMRLNGKGTKVTANSCTIASNKWSGVVVSSGTQFKMKKGTLRKNNRYGVYATKGAKFTMDGATSSNNKVDGVRLTGDKCSGTMKGCTVSGNKSSGIVVQSKGALNELSKCKVKNNKRYGLAVYAKCTVNKADGSKFTGNGSKQVYVQKGAKTKLKTV